MGILSVLSPVESFLLRTARHLLANGGLGV
jgi:hypothetical protein